METTKKLIVGIFVGACLLLFGVGLFLIGNSNQMFTKSFDVYADFAKITGIQNGGKVRVAGMDAGTVTRIEVPSRPEGKFRVHFRIIEKLHPIVRTDSKATIQTDGLLGNKFLQVDAGTSGAQLAQNGGMIPSAEPFDWGDLMDNINGVVKQVNVILDGVKEPLMAAIAEIETVAKSANVLIKDASPEVKAILASANKISGNLHEIIDGVQEGQGTMGALFKDEKLADSVRRSVDKTEKVIQNVRDTTDDAKRIVKKMEASEIVPEVQKTVKNLQHITAQVKDAVEKFQSASGEGGVAENLQRTLADAHEAMSDLSDDTEALKHNFLFRGFFKKRGFYDLGALTGPEYRSASFAKGFKKLPLWVESSDLFVTDPKGLEMLSAGGKAKLDAAMTEILQHPRNGPLILEGYSGAGVASQQYLVGRRRAAIVQVYLIARFHLRSAYVGIISLGAEAKPGGGLKEGVGIVSFYK
jgi:phospholipid/cholesterol/gamma-HCH transport system substrate-binding protein